MTQKKPSRIYCKDCEWFKPLDTKNYCCFNPKVVEERNGAEPVHPDSLCRLDWWFKGIKVWREEPQFIKRVGEVPLNKPIEEDENPKEKEN